jgi:hypothetical protein
MSNIHKIDSNIYITNDEDLKEGNWVIKISSLYKGGGNVQKYSFIDSQFEDIIFKKIILTTDPKLIEDGVQAIDNKFLEWFVKNPSCESVDINRDWGYPKIIIPQEESKQETLEEAAERIAYDSTEENKGFPQMKAFIKGANWQQERMYTEEDMIRFAEFVATYSDKNKNVYGEMLHAKSKYDGAERTIDLLEQFKNK